MVKIIRANTQDASQLVHVVKTLGYETDEQSLTDRLQQILQRHDHCVLVAKEGEKVIGFCHGYVRTLLEVPKAVEIGGLAVDEAWQGQGIAKNLVTGIESWTNDIGIQKVVLSSNIVRIKAHGFYKHLGYKKTKTQFSFEKNLQ